MTTDVTRSLDQRGLAGFFDAIGVRSLSLENRFVMSPMTRQFSPGGVPGGDVADYYARRAAGGVGLIVTEGTAIDVPGAVDFPDAPHIHGAAALAGWRDVVARVHAQGGRIIPQLWHQGPMFDPMIAGSGAPDGARPSGIWGYDGGFVSLERELVTRFLPPTRPMRDEEIADIIAAYARAAADAMAVGFDGIAIHAAHGYLIDSFFWSVTNRRVDRWGGDPRQRASFAVEVVKAIRQAVGQDVPIFFRFSQFKMQDYLTKIAESPDELEQLLGPVADAGVDVFDASQRYFDQAAFTGSNLNLAGWAKKLTGKMAMTVGGVGMQRPKGAEGVDRPLEAADNLQDVVRRLDVGEFDLVAVGRALLNDPEWVAKVRDDRPLRQFDPACQNSLY